MRTIIFVLAVFCTASSSAEIHANLNDKSFYKSDIFKVSHEGQQLRMQIFYEKSSWNNLSYSKIFVKEVSKNTMRYLFPFLKEKKLKKVECGTRPQLLKIFVVSFQTLNDRSRFSISSIENKGVSNSTSIVGYYDPTHYDWNSDSIILTNISKTRNNRLLAHEISHYFYNRFCIKTQTLQNTEPFAQEFESYYSKLIGL